MGNSYDLSDGDDIILQNVFVGITQCFIENY